MRRIRSKVAGAQKRWIYEGKLGNGAYRYSCPHCGGLETMFLPEVKRFCPWCGQRMAVPKSGT